MPLRSATVTFRLTPSEKTRLAADAERAGVSAGDHARRLVLAALDGGEAAQLREDIEVLRTELARLHKDLANSVLVLLEEAGKMSRPQASHWAHEHLKPPGRRG